MFAFVGTLLLLLWPDVREDGPKDTSGGRPRRRRDAIVEQASNVFRRSTLGRFAKRQVLGRPPVCH